MTQQQITIQPATREEYRLVFTIARMAASGDPAGQAAINKVAVYQEALWARAEMQREAGNDKAPSADGA